MVWAVIGTLEICDDDDDDDDHGVSMGTWPDMELSLDK